MVRRKKVARRKSKYSKSLIWTTLLVSVAFLLGVLYERYDISLDALEARIDSVTSSMWQWLDRPVQSEGPVIGEVHFFDVGQGSSTLLKGKDGTTILVDTGRYDDGDNKIIEYLNSEIGVGGEIDLLIFTHNDADHIGKGDLVLNYFQVNEVWMNGMDHTTQIYSRVLDALLENDVNYAESKRDEIHDIGMFTIEVLHPSIDTKTGNQNDESIVTRITIEETSLLLTGDVDSRIEQQIIEGSQGSLKSDIILLGHHGSRMSSSTEWLRKTDPSLAVYQAGENNSYGHPHNEVLERLDELDIQVIGTDQVGTISLMLMENNQFEIISGEE